MQRLAHLIYPPQCLGCGTVVADDFALCGPCWRETPFLGGLVCDSCGLPLPGEDDGTRPRCDECLQIARPWGRGRAALLYAGTARKMILGFKHADRAEMAGPAARWMVRVGQPIFRPNMLVAPVPLHWFRLLRRKYNQAALLSAQVAKMCGFEHCPHLLIRPRRTPSQEGRGLAARFDNMQGALCPHPRRVAQIDGREVLLIDDVMTSGATLAAAAEACNAAGAKSVSVLVLARVAKDI